MHSTYTRAHRAHVCTHRPLVLIARIQRSAAGRGKAPREHRRSAISLSRRPPVEGLVNSSAAAQRFVILVAGFNESSHCRCCSAFLHALGGIRRLFAQARRVLMLRAKITSVLARYALNAFPTLRAALTSPSPVARGHGCGTRRPRRRVCAVRIW